MKIRFVSFLLIITLLAFSACSRANEPSSSSEDLAPDFSLETTDGQTIVLSDILKEKKVVLDFWASRCFHCLRAMPALEKFYAENKDNVTVIGINIRESKTKVEEFVRKMGITYPVVLDSNGNVARTYNVRGIPTIVAVDQDSKILYYGHSIEEMKNKIK